MGYTHYYTINGQGLAISRDISYKKFTVFAESIITAAEEAGIQLADGHGETAGAWEISNDRVSLNGLGEDAHETFMVARGGEVDMFNFCKTAQKPYDTVVTALLIALHASYGDSVDISSDGGSADWVRGLELFESATGLKGKIPATV
jgi:hypothetical protein